MAPNPRAIVAILSIAGLAALAALLGVSLCPFATVTGLPCPGCGILRALVLLARGDVSESLHLHPVAPFATAVVAFSAWSFRERAHASRAREGALAVAGMLVLAAMSTVWALRFTGALGGPVPVNSVWSALGRPSPFVRSVTAVH